MEGRSIDITHDVVCNIYGGRLIWKVSEVTYLLVFYPDCWMGSCLVDADGTRKADENRNSMRVLIRISH